MAITLTDSRIKKKLSQLSPHFVGKHPYFDIQDLEDSPSKKSSKKSIVQGKRIRSSGSRILPPVVKITPKNEHYTSSTPLAAQIYKANSDELNRKRVKKKFKKSVLTLPNQRTARPQDHTVSDTNDSDYAQKSLDFLSNKKIPLECQESTWSSKEDSWPIKRSMKQTRAVQSPQHMKRRPQDQLNDNLKKPHNIWGMLRSMNRFQFRRSPPISDNDSDKTKKANDLNYDSDDVDMDSEIYGVNIEIKSKSSDYSRESSYGTTVIDTGGSNLKNSKQTKLSFKEKSVLTPKSQKTVNKINLNKQKKEVQSVIATYSPRKNEIETLKEHKSEANYSFDILNDNQKNPRNNKIGTIYYTNNKDRFKKTLPKPMIKNKTEVNKNIINSKPSAAILNRRPLHEPKTYDRLDPQKAETSIKNEEKGVPEIKWSQFDTKSNSRVNLNNKIAYEERAGIRRPELRANVSSAISKGRHNYSIAEIKRKLELIRFPLPVTEKNEVSSGFEVTTFDQFCGLENNLWPFMIDWVPRKKLSGKNNIGQSRTFLKQNIANKARTIENDGLLKIIRDNNEGKRNSKTPGNQNSTVATMRQTNKPKPMAKLRDDMLRVLYKNSSVGYYLNPEQINDPKIAMKCMQTKYNQPKPISALIQGENKIMISGNNNQRAITNPKVALNQKTIQLDNTNKQSRVCEENRRPERRPRRFGTAWPRASWASDFIDTVISKIKKGIYYTQENIASVKDNQIIVDESISDSRNMSMQTGSAFHSDPITESYESDEDVGQFYDAETDPLKDIDGFDDPISDVEIRSITKDKIVMKSYLANVVFQFDVVLAMNSTKTEDVIDYIPLGLTDSRTKIMKCSTCIVNAMLPAQLCSLLPAMLPNLKNFSENQQLEILPKEISAEIEVKPELLQIEMPAALSVAELPSKHATLLDGIFGHLCKKEAKTIFDVNMLKVHNNTLELAKQLRFSTIDFRAFVFADLKPLLKLPLLSSPPAIAEVTEPTSLSETANTCKALVLYNPFEHSLVRLVGLERVAQPLKILYDHFTKRLAKQVQEMSEAVACCDISSEEEIKSTQKQLTQESQSLHKVKRSIKKMRYRRYKTMYRKCRMSEPAAASKDANATALQNISDLGDFFKFLGKDCLASVMDSASESSLMAYLAQAKTWITEITPQQCLLLLLLANKKQTTNLVRFSEIVIQAIAVNRITKSSELDMEIEVIEKERFNPIAELNEITSSTSVASARKNLYDELVWIAKTTAADHQRQFDESSEKHLTTLLDKRKNLNPSYLRVMARYVGLGLLKTSKKPA